MAQLVAALTDFIILGQNTIHTPPGTQILTFIHQGCIDFAWGLILKSLTVEFLPNDYLLCLAKGARRNLWMASLCARSPSTIQTTPRYAQGATSRLDANALS